MSSAPTLKDMLDLINGAEEGQSNCSLGLFVTQYAPDDATDEGTVTDQLMVSKPTVHVESFMDNNELFWDITFQFKSCHDAEYRDMWRFLCEYTDRVRREEERLRVGAPLDKIGALSVSIQPVEYEGRYFVYANMPFPETITRRENSFDQSAVIGMVCEADGFAAFEADVDPEEIDREIVRDRIGAETAVEDTAEPATE